jgi:DNA mismatch endonuclease (patch repair protein)
MADVMTPEQRSRCMSRIRSKDTNPELAVRLVLRTLGIRYRLHARALPGRPDIVIRRLNTVIFVHGCFWHRHACRIGRPVPKSNVEFWKTKFAGNVARDRAARAALRRDGWSVTVLWECQTRDPAKLVERVERLLRKARRRDAES